MRCRAATPIATDEDQPRGSFRLGSPTEFTPSTPQSPFARVAAAPSLVIVAGFAAGDEVMVLKIVTGAAGGAEGELHHAPLRPVSIELTDLGLKGLPAALRWPLAARAAEISRSDMGAPLGRLRLSALAKATTSGRFSR